MKATDFSMRAIASVTLIASLMLATVTAVAGAAVPYNFVKGGVIKADEMNGNFAAVMDAISNIALTPGPQGPQGPAGASGFTITDAGVYVGQVGLGELGNFSLLTGAGGATGVAAANAACATAFPGSHAVLDILSLWKAAVDGVLPNPSPAYAYWASTATPIPVASSMGVLPRTDDCQGWTNNASGSGGFLRNNGTLSTGINVQLSTQSCTANNMAVACFTTTP